MSIQQGVGIPGIEIGQQCLVWSAHVRAPGCCCRVAVVGPHLACQQRLICFGGGLVDFGEAGAAQAFEL